MGISHVAELQLSFLLWPLLLHQGDGFPLGTCIPQSAAQAQFGDSIDQLLRVCRQLQPPAAAGTPVMSELACGDTNTKQIQLEQ
jgi:hypothetical protein